MLARGKLRAAVAATALLLGLAAVLPSAADAALQTTELGEGWVSSMRNEPDGSTRLLFTSFNSKAPLEAVVVPPAGGPVLRTKLLAPGHLRKWVTGALLPGDQAVLVDETRRSRRRASSVRVMLWAGGAISAPATISRPGRSASLVEMAASASGAAAIVFDEAVKGRRSKRWIALRGVGKQVFSRPVRVSHPGQHDSDAADVLYNDAGDGMLMTTHSSLGGIVVRRITRDGHIGAPIPVERQAVMNLVDGEAVAPDGTLAVAWKAERTVARRAVQDLRVATILPGSNTVAARPPVVIERRFYNESISAAWVGSRLFVSGLWWYDVVGRPSASAVRVYDATAAGSPTLVESELGQGSSTLVGIVPGADGAADLLWRDAAGIIESPADLKRIHRSPAGEWTAHSDVLLTDPAELIVREAAARPGGGLSVIADVSSEPPALTTHSAVLVRSDD